MIEDLKRFIFLYNMNSNQIFSQFIGTKIKFILLFSLIIALLQCSKTDSITGEKVLVEPNAQAKAKEYAEKGGGLFGDINNKKSSGTNYEFATSNVLWRATFKSLDFLPLVNADYSGGIIIYDWYSENLNSKEQVKITVRFLNNELKSSSIQVSAHKKICEENERCVISKMNEKFSNEIKETILSEARNIKIQEAKKEIK